MHKTRKARNAGNSRSTRNKSLSKPRLPSMPAADTWARAWQKHWSKVGLPGYELPAGGPGGDDREFLNLARTPEKERARLKRINDEFVRGFKGLFQVGPAVTVFGSARFKETHRYYKTGASDWRRAGQSRLCHADGRRSWHYGSGQSRRARSRR
jgi:hypothetical protein